jgi:thiol-disulfide isomerase/thioredoxin
MVWRLVGGVIAGIFLAGPASATLQAADPVDLAALRGKVVYLDFWASWCAPCRHSFPWMNGLQRSLGRDEFVIIAVNVDRDRMDANRFLAEYPPEFKVAFDPAGTLAERYHVHGMPTSILIDRMGNTVFVHKGFRVDERDALEKSIRVAVSAHPDAP